MDVLWTCEPAGCSLFKLRVSMVFFRLPALARARPLLFFMLACGITAARADISAQSLAGRPANLVTVQLAREGDVSIVTLEADGPLPEPTFGVAHDPFRFYVDFPNVAPESRGVLNSTDPLVLRVRVATYSIEPLISRVVLDLKRELPIRVDTDGRGAGRIRILVGMHKVMTAAKGTTPAQASVPPVGSLPASPPPPVTTSPTPTVQAPPSAKPTTPAPAPQPQNPPQQPPANKPVQSAPPTPPPAPPANPVSPPPVQTSPPPVQTPPVQALPPAQTPPVQTPPPNTAAPPPQKPSDPAAPIPGGTSGTPPPPPGFNPLATPPAGTAAKPQRGDDRYRAQINAPLDQLRGLRPLLASIDLLKTEALPGVPAAIERAESIRQSLAAIKPPPDLGPTHDMLLQSCTLAQRALKLRVSGADPAVLRNAGSAAAGALLLLDRVCIELGCESTAIKR